MNFEIILVDDGSYEETQKNLQEIALSDERIKVFLEKNGGVSHARNIGLSHAKGDYITFVDSDDIVKKDFLAEAIVILEENELDIVLSGLSYVYSDHSKDFFYNTEKTVEIYTDKEKSQLILFMLSYGEMVHKKEYKNYMLGSVSQGVYRKELFDNMVFMNGVYQYEDREMCYRLFCKARRVGVVPKIWYQYIQYDDSSIHRKRKDLYVNHEKLIRQMVESVNTGEPEIESGKYWWCLDMVREILKNQLANGMKAFDTDFLGHMKEIINNEYWKKAETDYAEKLPQDMQFIAHAISTGKVWRMWLAVGQRIIYRRLPWNRKE